MPAIDYFLKSHAFIALHKSSQPFVPTQPLESRPLFLSPHSLLLRYPATIIYSPDEANCSEIPTLPWGALSVATEAAQKVTFALESVGHPAFPAPVFLFQKNCFPFKAGELQPVGASVRFAIIACFLYLDAHRAKKMTAASKISQATNPMTIPVIAPPDMPEP